ncbi:hypothetical protein A2U01_0119032, partial [Trifolium medium]|nr:hypothetical protein [Trifolium medium]
DRKAPLKYQKKEELKREKQALRDARKKKKKEALPVDGLSHRVRIGCS